jgi:FKBP-type peptidyl-prolyl cis-trans isomerase 2
MCTLVLCCWPVQVVVNYVAMTKEGRVFENSLEKQPFDVRVGAGQVIPGLDEGLLSMKVSSSLLLTQVLQGNSASTVT